MTQQASAAHPHIHATHLGQAKCGRGCREGVRKECEGVEADGWSVRGGRGACGSAGVL
ncbi:hypothetical protein E2C01_080442 [Portunus trituberculatus]|uniref:Uncharacterized protein n=1 Tax=Portunus trituberculatus TaxID=210409 RepID=A0A5B7IM89_PORTR|nr:hypothetical protein [Portunus trituberculatus]